MSLRTIIVTGKTRRKHEKWEGFDGSSTIGSLGVVRGRRRRLARPGKRGERRLTAANPEALTNREEGEETKAMMPSLSRLTISDPSHSSGELWWSTRPKKDVRSKGKGGLGPWAGREDEEAFGRREGGHLACWRKASGNRSSNGGFWQWCTIKEEELSCGGSRRDSSGYNQKYICIPYNKNKVFLCSWLKSLTWLNAHLTKIWPYVDEAASELIMANLEPTIEQYRPMVLSFLSFSKFTLGTMAPKYTVARLIDRVSTVEDGGEGITMQLEMNWDGNPSIILDIKTRLGVGLLVQVKNIAFTGVLVELLLFVLQTKGVNFMI
ncbi:unnamed protein product [Lactuca saligna]|uniref:SMP-LTD domain-containing protein n=1 Tax=Lactuca saligna TaxID=75948 RepID=A0AA36EMP5_LACSI|nr:unnamed protein product [Lactuca saligna]